MGVVYEAEDLAPGKQMIFAATGVRLRSLPMVPEGLPRVSERGKPA
jgi:hypothetical protein